MDELAAAIGEAANKDGEAAEKQDLPDGNTRRQKFDDRIMESERHVGRDREQNAQADGVFHGDVPVAGGASGKRDAQSIVLPPGVGQYARFRPGRGALFQSVRKRVIVHVACTLISVYACFRFLRANPV